MSRLNLVVLGSTRGTNLQAIIDAISHQEVKADIKVVISNKEKSYILERAKKYGISTKFVNPKNLMRAEYDQILVSEIQKYNPDLILLIGFMRILSPIFINAFEGRVLNVHPSLLPKHSGLMDLDVHRAVIAANEKKSGCSIHQVTEKVDGGEIVLQLECDVEKNETAKSLKEKVQALESRAWVEIIKSWKSQ